MHYAILAFALWQMPVTCVDPASPLAQLVRVQPLPPTADRRANEYVARALETGTRADVWRAIKRLEDVLVHRHDDLAVHLAYGLMQSISTDLMPEGTEGYRHRRVYDNSNAESQVARHLKRAAELDPKQWLAGLTLARMALGIRDPTVYADALEVLQAQLAQDSANAALRIALADVLLARGQTGEALGLLEPVARSGCGAAAAVIAEARILRGDSLAAGMAYLAALGEATPDRLHRFYDDARVIMSTAERREYAALGAAAQRQWLRDFWARSAAASGREVAERIVEHVGRLAHAHRVYRLTRSTGRGNRPADNMRIEQAFHDNDVPWDARGATFVRHGPPDRVVETKVGSAIYFPINATWIYFGEDPPRMVHFAQPQKAGDPTGWYVVGTTFGVACGRASAAPPTVMDRPTNPRLDDKRQGDPRIREFAAGYYYDRAAYDPRYRVLESGCRNRASPELMRVIVTDMDRDYRTAVSSLLRSESAQRRYAKSLRMSLAAYEFRTGGGQPEVAGIAWVNLGDAAADGPLGSLRLRFALVDQAATPLRFDTTLTLPGVAAGSGAMLRFAKVWQDVTMRSPRLRAFAEDRADATRGADVAVGLMLHQPGSDQLSDIVIAESEKPGPLLRGSARMAPLPSHTIAVGMPFRLFYEVYGVAAGEPLATTIHVRRTDQEGVRELLRFFQGKSAERELRLDEPAVLDARGVAVRDISIGGDLLPGEYLVEVRVAGRFGTAVRRTRLRVLALPE